jgi:putative membrane protein
MTAGERARRGVAMFPYFVHLFVTAALLLIVARFVRGVEVSGWIPAILGALALGIGNALVRPVMVLLTLPFTLVTFGLFLLVVNALMLWLVAALVPGVRVKGFGPAFLGSLLLTVLNLLVAFLLDPR